MCTDIMRSALRAIAEYVAKRGMNYAALHTVDSLV
jgi:hypothetical protein